MSEELNDICLQLVLNQPAEAAVWKQYFEILINFLSKAWKIRYIGICITGSSVENGKFYRADYLSDVDIMFYSLKAIYDAKNLEYVQEHPGFVKIRLDIGNERNENYYPSKYLKHHSFEELSVQAKQLFTLVLAYLNSLDGVKVELNAKPGGAAFGFDMYTTIPNPIQQLQSSELDAVNKSFLNDISLVLSAGHDVSMSQQQQLLNELLHIIETGGDKNVLDLLKDVFEKATVDEKSNQVTASSSECCSDSDNQTVNEQAKDTASADTSVANNNDSDVNEKIQDFVLNHFFKDSSYTWVEKPSKESEITGVIVPKKLCQEDSVKSDSDNTGKSNFEKFGHDVDYEDKGDDDIDTMRKSGLDVVPAMKITGWPRICQHFIERERKWPSKEKLQDIVRSGFHVVAKKPVTQTQEEQYVFRLSFSLPEKLLCKEMSDIQLQTYQLMKALHYEEFKPIAKHFCSYHIKTQLFWLCDKNQPERWTSLAESVLIVLWSLYEALQSGYLEHYFIQNFNLFTELCENEREILASQILKILEEPEVSFQRLLKSIQVKADEMIKTVESKESTAARVSINKPDALHNQTFFAIWSEQYEMTSKCIFHHLNRRSACGNAATDFQYVINILTDIIDEGDVSLDGIERIFKEIKTLAYYRHMLNVSDACNVDIEGVVLSDMCIVADFIRDAVRQAVAKSIECEDSQQIEKALVESLMSSSGDGFDLSRFLPSPKDFFDGLRKLGD